MLRRYSVAIFAVLFSVAALGGTALADQNLYNYSFRSCSWTLVIVNPLPYGGEAQARTINRGGCSTLDADIQYKKAGSQTIYTKYCSSRAVSKVNEEVKCSIGSATSNPFRALLVAGRGSAQDAESGYYWQHSGWKYW